MEDYPHIEFTVDGRRARVQWRRGGQSDYTFRLVHATRDEAPMLFDVGSPEEPCVVHTASYATKGGAWPPVTCTFGAFDAVHRRVIVEHLRASSHGCVLGHDYAYPLTVDPSALTNAAPFTVGVITVTAGGTFSGFDGQPARSVALWLHAVRIRATHDVIRGFGSSPAHLVPIPEPAWAADLRARCEAAEAKADALAEVLTYVRDIWPDYLPEPTACRATPTDDSSSTISQ